MRINSISTRKGIKNFTTEEDFYILSNLHKSNRRISFRLKGRDKDAVSRRRAKLLKLKNSKLAVKEPTIKEITTTEQINNADNLMFEIQLLKASVKVLDANQTKMYEMLKKKNLQTPIFEESA